MSVLPPIQPDYQYLLVHTECRVRQSCRGQISTVDSESTESRQAAMTLMSKVDHAMHNRINPSQHAHVLV
jgi:hypothetical protein